MGQVLVDHGFYRLGGCTLTTETSPGMILPVPSTFNGKGKVSSWWFLVSTHLKNIHQIGSFPQASG